MLRFQRRTALVVVLVLLSAAAVGGCRPAIPTPTEPAAPPAAVTPPSPAVEPKEPPPSDFPITITDQVGRQVTIDRQPKRIVSLAPSNTEVLGALGALDRVVGVTDLCNYPDVGDTPRLGLLFDAKHTNFEVILGLEPDLAVAIGGHPEVISRLEELGITVLAIDPNTVDEVLTAIEMVAAAIGEVEAGRVLVDDLTLRLLAVRSAVDVAESERPLVLFEIWGEPLMVAGCGSFIGNLIEVAGGRNIAADASDPYPMLSREVVIERDPEVIITTFPETLAGIDSGERVDLVGTRAVANGRVILIDQDIVSRPAPRFIDAIEQIARALHPQRFGQR